MRILIVFFFITLLIQTAFACTCIDYGKPIRKLYQDADSVFIGKIERITSAMADKSAKVSLQGVNSISSIDAGLVVVHFKLEKSFKGTNEQTIKALTYRGTSCDLEIKKGKRWIIFSKKDNETGLLYFGACSENGEIKRNSDEEKELENLSKINLPSIISGRISKDQFDNLKGAKVLIEGNGLKLLTVTDELGYFEFSPSQLGKYTIKIFVPFTAGALRRLGDVPIKEFPNETETTLEYETEAKPNYYDYNYIDVYGYDFKAKAKITWQFSQSSDQHYDVELCRIKPTEIETISSCNWYETKNSDGSYSFGNLREGKYIIVLNKNDFPELHSPFLRHYFPGVRDFSQAQIINLEQAQQLTLPDFKIPSPMPLKEIKGQLFWKKGVPITKESLTEDGVYFSFYNPQKPQSSLNMSCYISPNERENGIIFNEDGSFSFQAFYGMKYIVNFSAENKKGKYFSKKIEMEIDDNLQTLEIILEKNK